MERDQGDQSPPDSDAMSELSQMSDFERRMNAEVREKERNRDERRLRNATIGRVQAFSKARAPPKLSLTMNALERHEDASFESGEIDATNAVRPTPANIPRTWGRKAKHDNDWLLRIHQDEPVDRKAIATSQVNSTFHVAGSPQEVDWMNVEVEDALPSIEDSSPLRKTSVRRQHLPEPHQNTSIEEILRLEREEEEDYSAESPVAQASERRRRLLSRRSHQISEHKKEGAWKLERDVALPESPSRNSLRSILERDNIINHITDDYHINSTMSLNQKSPRPPLPALKSARTVSVSNFEVEALAEASGNRARPHRHDSRELLRSLARASASPSSSFEKRPSSSRKEHTGKYKEQVDEQGGEHEREKIGRKTSTSGSPTEHPNLDRNPPTIAAEGGLESPVQLPPGFRKAETLSVPALHHRLPTPPDNTTPDARQGLAPKTPIVTGAWVDTPFIKKQKEPDIIESTSPLEEIETLSTKVTVTESKSQPDGGAPMPVLPRSAATSIVEASAAMNKDSLTNDNTIGDSTLESLRDVAGQDIDYSTINMDVDLDLDDGTLNMIENVNVPVNQAARDRQLEALAMQRMRKRLKAVRTGLRDASRGMKRVEREIETAEMASEATSVGKGGAPENSCKQCAQCTGRQITLSSLVTNAWRYFTSYFYTWPADRRWRWAPRLTWLGLSLLLFTIWSLSEVTLCDYYCHPLYAVSMDGYGVDINAPTIPYVATTVLLARPTKWLWRPLLEAAGVEFELGRDFPRWQRAPPVAAKRDWMPELRASQGLHVEGLEGGVDWSMLDDRYL